MRRFGKNCLTLSNLLSKETLLSFQLERRSIYSKKFARSTYKSYLNVTEPKIFCRSYNHYNFDISKRLDYGSVSFDDTIKGKYYFEGKDLCEIESLKHSDLLARLRIIQRRPASAIEIVCKISEAMNQSNEPVDQRKLSELEEIRSLAFVEMKEYSEALSAVENAIELFPLSPSAYAKKGFILYKLGDMKGAEDQFKISINNDNQFLDSWICLSKIYWKQNRFEESLEAVLKSLEINPNYYEGQLVHAALLEASSKIEEAQEAYTKAIKIRPESAAAYINFSQAYVNQGNINSAIELAKLALRTDPNHAISWAVLGILLIESKPQIALQAFDRAISLDSKLVLALEGKAMLCVNEEEWEEVIKLTNEILDIQKNNSTAYCLQGKAYFSMVKYDESFTCFDKAVEIDPYSKEAYIGYFEILNQIGQQDKLFDVIDQSLKNMPDFVEAHMARANAWDLFNEKEKALETYKHVLKIDPSNYTAFIGLVNCFLSLKKLEEAEKYLNNPLVPIDRSSAPMNMLWSKYYCLLGKKNEAIRYMEAVTAVEPNFKAAWLEKGDLYMQVDRFEEALNSFEKYLELDPNNPMAMLRKVDACYALGHYEEALNICNNVMQKDNTYLPLVLKVKLKIYRVLEMEEDYKKAESLLESLSVDNPENSARGNQSFFGLDETLGDDAIKENNRRLRELKSGKTPTY